MLIVRSAIENAMSTPAWVATVNGVVTSVVGCGTAVGPERSTYSFGRRIWMVEPGFCPATLGPPNSSCHWRSTICRKALLLRNSSIARRTTKVGVMMLLAIEAAHFPSFRFDAGRHHEGSSAHMEEPL